MSDSWSSLRIPVDPAFVPDAGAVVRFFARVEDVGVLGEPADPGGPALVSHPHAASFVIEVTLAPSVFPPSDLGSLHLVAPGLVDAASVDSLRKRIRIAARSPGRIGPRVVAAQPGTDAGRVPDRRQRADPDVDPLGKSRL